MNERKKQIKLLIYLFILKKTSNLLPTSVLNNFFYLIYISIANSKYSEIQPDSWNDSDLGRLDLYYSNARYYDATIGRFINVDMIQDGTNWYVYCSNNPMNAIDPTGLMEDDIALGNVKEFSDQKIDSEKTDAYEKVTKIDYTETHNVENSTLTTTYHESTTLKIKETEAGKEYAANLNKQADMGKTATLALVSLAIPGAKWYMKVAVFALGNIGPNLDTSIYEDGSTITREATMTTTLDTKSMTPPKIMMQESICIYNRPREGNDRKLVHKFDFEMNE